MLSNTGTDHGRIKGQGVMNALGWRHPRVSEMVHTEEMPQR
jgi:hypothetical protein